jgi:hypothetical protein
MEIKQLLINSREIWGDKKCNLLQIIVRMGKVFGDICRYARNEKKTDAVAEDELKKELGNMIFSTIRWCDDLGYDPQECIDLAIIAQKNYTKKTNKPVV